MPRGPKTETRAKQRTILILGAGASRAVSYAHLGAYPSPLDADFFDLLQRLKPRDRDKPATEFVLEQVAGLPHSLRRSMERAFYTLHLRAYLSKKLSKDATVDPTDEKIVECFARCVQALLRKAHGKRLCESHLGVISSLAPSDVIVTFNYDLVAERVFRRIVEENQARSKFGRWTYGFESSPRTYDLPVLLKLHGSSNWKLAGGGFEVRTKDWADLDEVPGYLGHKGVGTAFPIFLPFWDKRIEEKPWLSLWQRAFEELKQATEVVVWGSSLPPTDVKAQQLFILGLGDRRFRLCVIDPSPATRERWRELFPNAQYWEYQAINDFLKYSPTWWEEKKQVK